MSLALSKDFCWEALCGCWTLEFFFPARLICSQAHQLCSRTPGFAECQGSSFQYRSLSSHVSSLRTLSSTTRLALYWAYSFLLASDTVLSYVCIYLSSHLTPPVSAWSRPVDHPFLNWSQFGWLFASVDSMRSALVSRAPCSSSSWNRQYRHTPWTASRTLGSLDATQWSPPLDPLWPPTHACWETIRWRFLEIAKSMSYRIRPLGYQGLPQQPAIPLCSLALSQPLNLTSFCSFCFSWESTTFFLSRMRIILIEE